MILEVAGNRCKMENCVATMTGKESLLRMLDAKKMKNSFTLLWLNFSKKVPRRDGAAADVILKVLENR